MENSTNTQGNNHRNKGTHLNIPKPKNTGTNLNNRTINQQGNVGQGQKATNQQYSPQSTKLNGQGNYTNGQKKNQSSGGQGNQKNPQGTRKNNEQGTKPNQGYGTQVAGGQGPVINQGNTILGSQPTAVSIPNSENGKSLQELLQEFSTTRFTEIPIKLSTVTSQPNHYPMQEQITEKAIMSQTVSQKKSDDKGKKNSGN